MVEEKKEDGSGWDIRTMQERLQQHTEGGPNRTPEETEELRWQDTKNKHVSQLTESELKRALEEKRLKQLKMAEDARKTQVAFQAREKEFWDGIVKNCLDGTPEERLARCLIRASMKGVFTLNPMQQPQDKAKILSELLKFHGIQIRESKSKPSREEFEQTVVFVSDPFIRKGDVTLTRRAMFPKENKTDTTVGGEKWQEL